MNTNLQSPIALIKIEAPYNSYSYTAQGEVLHEVKYDIVNLYKYDAQTTYNEILSLCDDSTVKFTANIYDESSNMMFQITQEDCTNPNIYPAGVIAAPEQL